MCQHLSAHGIIQQAGQNKTDNKSVQQRLKRIEQAFKIQHAVELFRRHAHRFQHRKFPSPQSDIGAQGIENVNNAHGSQQDHKTVNKNRNNMYGLAVGLAADIDIVEV